MPLPHLPDGPEKPPTLAGEPGAPATASPQAALLAALWAAVCEAGDDYEGADTTANRSYAGGALDATQAAVTAVLVHLYGMPYNEAQVRVQRAHGAGQDNAQALL
jgi:hypothetical protein